MKVKLNGKKALNMAAGVTLTALWSSAALALPPDLASMFSAASGQAKAILSAVVTIAALIGVVLFIMGIMRLRHLGDPQMRQQINVGQSIAMLLVGAALAGGGIWLVSTILGSVGVTGVAAPTAAPSL